MADFVDSEFRSALRNHAIQRIRNPNPQYDLYDSDLARLDHDAGLLRLRAGHRLRAQARRRTSTAILSVRAARSRPGSPGLAFLSANLGAQEVIGMAASGAKYGIMTSHFYWVGAIPAMVFVGIFMMPFYYGSRARSVPEYLKLRFDEKTRGFNAITFAVMTVFSSGISMYALAQAAADAGARAGTSTSACCCLGRHRAGLHLPRRPDLARSTTRCCSSS